MLTHEPDITKPKMLRSESLKPTNPEAIIDNALLAQLRKDIAKIGIESNVGISKRQAVILLLPEITDARNRKVSFKSISAGFKVRGIIISAATLGRYYLAAIADKDAVETKPDLPIIIETPPPQIDTPMPEIKNQDDVEPPKSTIEFRNIEDEDKTESDEDFIRRVTERRLKEAKAAADKMTLST